MIPCAAHVLLVCDPDCLPAPEKSQKRVKKRSTRDYNGALDLPQAAFLADGTLFCARYFVKVGSKWVEIGSNRVKMGPNESQMAQNKDQNSSK